MKWINKNTVYPNNTVLFGDKKGTKYLCYNVDEPGKHMLSEGSQEQKAAHCRIPRVWHVQHMESYGDRTITGWSALDVAEMVWRDSSSVQSFRGKQNVQIRWWVMLAQPYEYTKKQQILNG